MVCKVGASSSKHLPQKHARMSALCASRAWRSPGRREQGGVRARFGVGCAGEPGVLCVARCAGQGCTPCSARGHAAHAVRRWEIGARRASTHLTSARRAQHVLSVDLRREGGESRRHAQLARAEKQCARAAQCRTSGSPAQEGVRAIELKRAV